MYSPPPFGHRDLKPGTFAGSAVLGDGYPGDYEDLPGKEQPKPGIFPEAPGEETFFILRQKFGASPNIILYRCPIP